MNYWLAKSEPFKYSWDDFLKDGSTYWDGVRNYEARNQMKSMRLGDRIFFYHSNAEPSAVVGEVRVVREAYPEKNSPGWFQVDLKFHKKFPKSFSIKEAKSLPALKKMALVTRGRLSVQPVTAREWSEVETRCLRYSPITVKPVSLR